MKSNLRKRFVSILKSLMLQSKNYHLALKLKNKRLSISSKLTNFTNVDFKLLPKMKINLNLLNKLSLISFQLLDKSVKPINFQNPLMIWIDALRLQLHQWIPKKLKNVFKISTFLKNKRFKRSNKLQKKSKIKQKANLTLQDFTFLLKITNKLYSCILKMVITENSINT